MSFRFVPNSVTLDDLEQRNSPNYRVISPNSNNGRYIVNCALTLTFAYFLVTEQSVDGATRKLKLCIFASWTYRLVVSRHS